VHTVGGHSGRILQIADPGVSDMTIEMMTFVELEKNACNKTWKFFSQMAQILLIIFF